jgi:hypothetical protein
MIQKLQTMSPKDKTAVDRYVCMYLYYICAYMYIHVYIYIYFFLI